jgi:SpoVK/Ycf46/Vps4 family AAA+-type ATPase
MRKRKHCMSSDNNSNKRKHKFIIKSDNVPIVNSIYDLIELGRCVKIYKNIDTSMLWRITFYLEELDKLIGMQSVKESILHQVMYYLKGFHLKNNNEDYLHTIIMGPPGTGKTTVARIIGRLYQSMGILSKDGLFKIVNRDDFIAGYIGQTAIKTRNLLSSCIGGVLFVDEVYSLGSGNEKSDKDSFSKECIDTITSFLSEHKNDFCFICAGYEDDIKRCFFNANKGIERRFQWVHNIEKYTDDDLADIMIKMIKEIEWEICIDRSDIIKLIKNNNNLFKNAGGDIENFLTKCKMVHAKRVFSLGSEHMFVLTQKDFDNSIKLMKNYRIKEIEDDKNCMSMYN